MRRESDPPRLDDQVFASTVPVDPAAHPGACPRLASPSRTQPCRDLRKGLHRDVTLSFHARQFTPSRRRETVKAMDIGKLEVAIRSKLDAQAEFVLWWDTHAEKVQGARGDKRPNSQRRNGSVTPLKAGENGLPDRMTISRWRRKLNTPRRLRAMAGVLDAS